MIHWKDIKIYTGVFRTSSIEALHVEETFIQTAEIPALKKIYKKGDKRDLCSPLNIKKKTTH